MATLDHWLWLTTRTGLTSSIILELLDHFGGPEPIYYGDTSDYALLPPHLASLQTVLLDKSLQRVHHILEECDRLELHILTLQDADYPQRLKEIPDPPALLYWKGKRLHFDQEVAIGVVGSRQVSPYGGRVASRLGFGLAQGGALVLSGIAQGIDALALQGALQGGGSVVSILAGGIDVIYPRHHQELYEDVAASGALISSYPPGTPHRGSHFPRRNRIISGLSLGVVAVECRRLSGTMLTMEHAMEQNRDLFAIPGPVDAPNSQGPNWLIQQGAKLVTQAQDILEEYRSQFPLKLSPHPSVSPQVEQARLQHLTAESAAPSPPSSPSAEPSESSPVHSASPALNLQDLPADQQAVLQALQYREGPSTVDELVEDTQIAAHRVLAALTLLQVSRAVEECPGGRFLSNL